jgi:hypothetical protein
MIGPMAATYAEVELDWTRERLGRLNAAAPPRRARRWTWTMRRRATPPPWTPGEAGPMAAPAR